jgi:hypothetical protein
MSPLEHPLLPLISAIGGSVIGACSSLLSAWIVQRHRERLELVEKRAAELGRLYSDFIDESARLLVDAVQHSLEDPGTLVPVYALLSRIRLNSSSEVIASGERLLDTILTIYFEPNLAPEDIRGAASRHNDHLQEFSHTCRRELETLRRRL